MKHTHWKYTGLIAILSLAGYGHELTAQGRLITGGQSANYGTAVLAPGFPNDPFQVNVVSGGSINAAALGIGQGCIGNVTQQPDFILRMTGNSPNLRVHVEVPGAQMNGDGDTTLIVNLPNGSWRCNDDSFNTPNPTVDLSNAGAGQYDIWVGSFRPNTRSRGVLVITELTNLQPSTQPLAPAIVVQQPPVQPVTPMAQPPQPIMVQPQPVMVVPQNPGIIAPQAMYHWVPASQGAIPQGAVAAGREPGRILYVCRAQYNGGVHPGKVVGTNCNIGWGGREITLPSYEVLVGPPGRWTPAASGYIPPNSFPAGFENGQPLYLCRAPHSGGLHPGKVIGSACNFGWGGREISIQQYEVFTP